MRNGCTYHLQPSLWKRFIDDIFLIWPHGMDSLLEFIQHLNTVHSTIKFTSVISSSEIAFLDLTIYITDDNTTYTTITKGTCQSNNLIYCLECKWCHIKYVGQTKNRIIDRFQGHIFDIKHNNSTTVARHFHCHHDQTNPSMIIHILEYIRMPRDVPTSKSIRDNRELVWIHRLNTLISNGLNMLDWGKWFMMSQRV